VRSKQNNFAQLFKAFGNVFEVKIIRDNATHESRGCCFVTFEQKVDADRCIQELNNKHTLPPVSKRLFAAHQRNHFSQVVNPMQVRYADSEQQTAGGGGAGMMMSASATGANVASVGEALMPEHKLFVGQLPRDTPDEELRKLFEPFGAIEEFKVLRDPSGVSKG
jgi:CUG-BP- and ETR3-like factor